MNKLGTLNAPLAVTLFRKNALDRVIANAGTINITDVELADALRQSLLPINIDSLRVVGKLNAQAARTILASMFQPTGNGVTFAKDLYPYNRKLPPITIT